MSTISDLAFCGIMPLLENVDVMFMYGQEIDVVGLPIDQIDQFVADNSLAKPPGVLFGALWLKNHLGSR